MGAKRPARRAGAGFQEAGEVSEHRVGNTLRVRPLVDTTVEAEIGAEQGEGADVNSDNDSRG